MTVIFIQTQSRSYENHFLLKGWVYFYIEQAIKNRSGGGIGTMDQKLWEIVELLHQLPPKVLDKLQKKYERKLFKPFRRKDYCCNYEKAEKVKKYQQRMELITQILKVINDKSSGTHKIRNCVYCQAVNPPERSKNKNNSSKVPKSNYAFYKPPAPPRPNTTKTKNECIALKTIYQLFTEEVRPQILKKFPLASESTLEEIIKQKWVEMDPITKQNFVARMAQRKQEETIRQLIKSQMQAVKLQVRQVAQKRSDEQPKVKIQQDSCQYITLLTSKLSLKGQTQQKQPLQHINQVSTDNPLDLSQQADILFDFQNLRIDQNFNQPS